MFGPISPAAAPLINPESGYGKAPGVGRLAELAPAAGADEPGEASGASGVGESFAAMLRKAVESEGTAQQAADSYATGATQNLHETMIAMEKADITVSLLVNVRNKLLDAYREVMKMS